jgi:MFS family permease
MSIAICSPLLGLLFDRQPQARHPAVPDGVRLRLRVARVLTPRLWHLYAVFAVLGCVGNGTAQMGYSRAVSSWFLRRRGMALALVMSGGSIGAMVLPPTAQWLVNQIGWRQAALTLGVMVLVVGLPMVIGFIRERPAVAAGRDEMVEAPRCRRGREVASVRDPGDRAVRQLGGAERRIRTFRPADRRGVASQAAIALSALAAASLLGLVSSGGAICAGGKWTFAVNFGFAPSRRSTA